MCKKMFLVILILISCKQKKEDQSLSKEISNCIKISSKEYAEDLFNIYDHYIELEKILIQKGFLLSKNKKGYKKLYQNLFNSKKNYKKYTNLFNDIIKKIKHSEMLVDPGVLQASLECNKFFLEKNKLNKIDYYLNYYNILEKVLKEMTPNNDQLYLRLVENTPNSSMSNIIYRAPLLAIFFANLNELVILEGNVRSR